MNEPLDLNMVTALREVVRERDMTIAALQRQNQDLQHILSIATTKFGSPVILTDEDLEKMPRQGLLHISTDSVTHTITITFEDQEGKVQ